MDESNNSIILPGTLNDIWKMNDSTFYKEVLKPLEKNIKTSKKEKYKVLEFECEMKFSKNQRKLLQERLRRYRENLKYSFSNDSVIMTFLVTIIAVFISIVVYFITSTKGFTGEMYSISAELDNYKKSDIEIIEAIEVNELINIGKKMEYLISFNNTESTIFLILMISLAVVLGGMLHQYINLYIRHRKIERIDLVLRQK